MNKRIIYFATLFLAFFINHLSAQTLVIDENFNQYPGAYTNYTLSMLNNDFVNILRPRASGAVRGFDAPGVTWPQNNVVGNGVFRANFPANSAGGPASGFLFDKRIDDTEEAVMEYRIFFQGAGSDNKFVFASGGKLPGLAGSSLDNVGCIPVGCTKNTSNITNGFSARLMWRKKFANDEKSGKLVAYTYFPNRDISKCGVDYDIADAVPNTWYKIRQYIKLNTPGVNNGILKVWVNDVLKVNVSNILYREAGKGAVKINAAVFHSYRGGSPNDIRFYSPNNDYIQFDDFKVWKDAINGNTGGGTTGNTVQMVKRNASGFAIDGGIGGQNGQTVYLWTSNSSNVNQQWIEIPRGYGYYSYQKINTNFCIDGGNGGASQQPVVLWAKDDNNQNQHWKRIPVGDGYYRLEKRNSPGFSLDGGNGGANGQAVYLFASNNANQNQHWKLNATSGNLSSAKNSEVIFKVPVTQNSNIYPNPSKNGIFNLKSVQDYQVVSAVGYKVTEGKGNQIDLSAYPKGIYLVKIGNEVSKIIFE